ncbi:MAG: thiamine pyrophosphate-binding protein [Myxococcota bacterium]
MDSIFALVPSAERQAMKEPSSRTTQIAAPLRAADTIARWLEDRGITRVYGIPGGAISPFFDALNDCSLELVECQHEGMAGHLAAGEALATRRPGVLAVTSGPGILNAITPIAAAKEDEIPLLVLVGEVRSEWSGKGALQDGGPQGLNIGQILQPLTRFQAALDEPGSVVELMESAWQAAMTYPQGPAVIRLPVDQALARLQLPDHSALPPPPQPVMPDQAAIEEAAQHLREAKRGAIIAGLGAQVRELGPELSRLAAQLKMPILTDIEARSLFAPDDPMVLGALGIGQTEKVSRYLAEPIDVLLTVGVRLDDTSTAGFTLTANSDCTRIQMDHDPVRIGRAFAVDVAIVGDLALACEHLVEACGRRQEAGPSQPIVVPTPPFDPRVVVEVFEKRWPANTRFLSDIGNHLLFSAAMKTPPGGFQVRIGLGGMGASVGRAMGMAAEVGGVLPIVCICGDGTMLMVGNELATAVRYRVPLVLAVFDDGGWGMVNHGMKESYGRSAHGDRADVSLVDFARAMGAQAIDVMALSDLEPPDRLDGPLVLRIPIDPTVRPTNPRAAGFKGKNNAKGR